LLKRPLPGLKNLLSCYSKGTKQDLNLYEVFLENNTFSKRRVNKNFSTLLLNILLIFLSFKTNSYIFLAYAKTIKVQTIIMVERDQKVSNCCFLFLILKNKLLAS
jgi:hypothetical protein